jgi:putative ABC transport system substrate-binding protein
MRRREVVAGMGSVAVAWPPLVHAQQPMPVIGMLAATSPDAARRQLDGFRRGLESEGFVDGRNVAIEYRWAAGDYDRLPTMAADLVARKVSVIAAFAVPPALAAKAATTTIPVVFYSGIDPIELGLVQSLTHPGGNLTGLSAFLHKLVPKRIQLLHELVPHAKTFGLLVNPNLSSAPTEQQDTVEAARALDIVIVVARAGTVEELDAAFASLAGKADALTFGPDPFFAMHRSQTIGLAAHHRLPTMYWDRQDVEAGGLMSYGDSVIDTWHQAGVYVGKVLRGARPGDLPVAQPTKFELVINTSTARALGLTVPPALLAEADEVIE